MTTRLYIFGTGAHARKVHHYATLAGWQVAAFVDEAAQPVAPVAGVPVLNADTLPAPTGDDAMFIAIGRPEVRRRLMDRMAAAGWRLPALVHATAWVAPDAALAPGVLVAAGAVVETGCIVERGAIVDIGVVIDHDSRIGAFAHLRAGTACGPRSHVPAPEGSA